jgi:hypothetical protein
MSHHNVEPGQRVNVRVERVLDALSDPGRRLRHLCGAVGGKERKLREKKRVFTSSIEALHLVTDQNSSSDDESAVSSVVSSNKLASDARRTLTLLTVRVSVYEASHLGGGKGEQFES